MSILIQLFEILTLKRRPQDIAYEPMALLLYFVMALGLTYIYTATMPLFSRPGLISLVQTVSQGAALYGFLFVANKRTRFVQTATAMFGTLAILSALSLVLAQIPVLALFAAFFTLWSFYIMVLIFRDAFEVSIIFSILLVLALNLLAGMLTGVLLPEYFSELQEAFVMPSNSDASSQ